MKTTLAIIGAVVVTIVVLWIPVLSFLSFIYDWHEFFILSLIMASGIDFFFVLNMLMGETGC